MEGVMWNLSWENHYSWTASVEGDKYKRFSKLYLKTFQIDSPGISQVKLHDKSNAHKNSCPTNQTTLICNIGLSQRNLSN